MSGFFARLFTGIVGAIAEAWAEVRVHRGRVLLSLIGVGVAVAALTAVVAAGSVAEQALRESSERSGGRAATMAVSAYTDDGTVIPTEDMRTAFTTAIERYDISYASEHGYGEQQVRLPTGRQPVSTETVDIPFGQMHRVSLIAGAWFTAADERRLAPALVINERLWEQLGSPEIATHPTITIAGTVDTTAVVVGVTPSPSFDVSPSMIMLASQARALQTPEQQEMYGTPQYEVWVPPEIGDELGRRLSADIGGQLGDGVQVDAFRSDYAEQNASSLQQVQLIVGGIAVLVLLLGALGLVNIALVTVRTRIREIGVRRTFGATAGRVFFAVMLESVVATVAAGGIGVMLAVLLIRNPITLDFLAQGISDVPPFPMSAAIVGLIASTAVGALAGLIPALVAVRVKVIDAIRY